MERGGQNRVLRFLLGQSRARDDIYGQDLKRGGRMAARSMPAKKAFSFHLVPVDGGTLIEPGQVMCLSLGVQKW